MSHSRRLSGLSGPCYSGAYVWFRHDLNVVSTRGDATFGGFLPVLRNPGSPWPSDFLLPGVAAVQRVNIAFGNHGRVGNAAPFPFLIYRGPRGRFRGSRAGRSAAQDAGALGDRVIGVRGGDRAVWASPRCWRPRGRRRRPRCSSPRSRKPVRGNGFTTRCSWPARPGPAPTRHTGCTGISHHANDARAEWAGACLCAGSQGVACDVWHSRRARMRLTLAR